MSDTKRNRDEAMRVLGETADSFNLMMAAKTAEINPPVTITPSFDGTRDECMEHGETIADEVRAEGYNVEVSYLEEAENAFADSDVERHRIEITVTV